MKVFYAWEIGEDLGHITQFLALALELRRRGHDVITALRELPRAENIIGRHGVTMLQALLDPPNRRSATQRDAGAGVFVDRENPHRDFKAAVGQLVNNPGLARQAKGFASRFSGFTSLSTVAGIANECEGIVRQPSNVTAR
jgi:hypothetical protein